MKRSVFSVQCAKEKQFTPSPGEIGPAAEGAPGRIGLGWYHARESIDSSVSGRVSSVSRCCVCVSWWRRCLCCLKPEGSRLSPFSAGLHGYCLRFCLRARVCIPFLYPFCQPPHHINYIYYPQSPAEIASVKGRGRLGCASSKFQSAARDIALHPPAAAPVLRRAAWRFSAVCFTAGWEGSLALQHTDLERIMTF